MIRVHSVGPYRGIEVYWGVEREIPVWDIKNISHAWLVEDLPPFRRSTWGCRLRFGSRALHFGRCVRADDPHRHLVEVPAKVISHWRGPSNAVSPQGKSTVYDQETDAESVGEASFIGSGATSGVIPQQDGRIVSWTITQGTGDRVAASGDGDERQPGPGGDPDPA